MSRNKQRLSVPLRPAPDHPLARMAIERLRQGDIPGAEAAARALLNQIPDHVPVLLMLGQILTDRGEAEAAMSVLGRAVAKRPDLALVHFNMGRAALTAGHLKIAIAAFRRTTEIDPTMAVAHRNLSGALNDAKNHGEALSHARRAVELEPDVAENHFVAATVLEALKRPEPAIGAFLRAIELDPTRAETHNALGRVYQLANRPEQAVPYHRRAIELQPDYAVAYSMLGTALQTIHEPAAAEAAYRRAVELNPSLHVAWNAYGTLLRAFGRFDEAAVAFGRAIEIMPDFGAAHRNLATCQKEAADASQLQDMERVLADTSLTLDARAQAGLGLGKWLDDAGRYDEAFERFREANALTRQAETEEGKAFDLAALQAEIDQLITTFTPDFFAERRSWGTETDLPVFIVGLFRSGTTLTEQIAASHPEVFGAGELTEMRQLRDVLALRPADALDWRQETIAKAAQAHLARLQRLGRGAIRVVDKNPDNIFSLGLVATMYPQARIIICHRDGRDTALSCYFQGFSRSQSFASDLLDCGRRWIETERMADHWREALPRKPHEITYETLVGDLEGESRRLIEFLGLDWDPACLSFHETERSVKTASMWQVRQPLYASSVGRWKHYERHIGDLLTLLGSHKSMR